MSSQGLEIIEHSAQTAHEWVNELAGRLDWTSKRSALRMLRTTLHLVRDHLPIDEMAQFSAQLPLLIRCTRTCIESTRLGVQQPLVMKSVMSAFPKRQPQFPFELVKQGGLGTSVQPNALDFTSSRTFPLVGML